MPDLSNIHYKFFPKAKTANTGKRLYQFAWAIEILVALVALSISVLMLLTDGQSGATTKGLFASIDIDKLLLSFAFIVVAVMELTKIPLATAFYYSARLNWKILFFVALLVVNFSTFETMITAFELNYAKRSQAVDSIRSEIDAIASKIDTLNVSNDSTELEIKRKSIENEINENKNSLKELQSNYRKSTSELRKATQIDLNNIDDDRNASNLITEKNSSNIQPQIDGNLEVIRRLTSKNEALEKKMRIKERERENVPNTVFSNADDIQKQEITKQIDKIQDDIELNEEEIKEKEEANSRLRESSSTTLGSATAKNNDNASRAKDDIRAQAEREQADMLASYQAEKSKLENLIEDIRVNKLEPNNVLIANLAANEEKKIADLKQLRFENDEKKDELQVKAKENQVYRMAQKINMIANWLSGEDKDPLLVMNDEKIEKLTKDSDNLKIDNKGLNRKINTDDNVFNKSNDSDILELEIQLAENQEKIASNEDNIERLKVENKRILEKDELTDGVISQSEMDRAFWLWFGGLSFVISIIGTLVAFAGLHLQDERTHKILNKPLSSNKMIRHFKLTPVYINKAFKALKKRLLQPVKVTVYEEIEVEKIVERIVEKPYEVEKIVEKPIEHIKVEFQRIEIPKEIIRKEIVYVPFPTNDKGILDKGPYKVKNNKKEYTEEEE